jgi:hypothetical protein
MGTSIDKAGAFSVGKRDRFEAVYGSGHNHLRFVRVSACLSVAGFRWLGRAFAGFLLEQGRLADRQMHAGERGLLEKLADCDEVAAECCMTASEQLKCDSALDRDSVL